MAMPIGTRVRLIKGATNCYGTFPVGRELTYMGVAPKSADEQWLFETDLGVVLLLSPKYVHDFIELVKPVQPELVRVVRIKTEKK